MEQLEAFDALFVDLFSLYSLNMPFNYIFVSDGVMLVLFKVYSRVKQPLHKCCLRTSASVVAPPEAQ